MHQTLKILNVFSYKEQVARSNSWGHHFLFLNILLAIFIGSVYVYAAPHTVSFISFIYLLITWFGQMSFLAFLTYLIILFPISFIGRYHLYRIISVIIACIAFIILLVDAKLFLSARVHISATVLSLIFGDLDFKTGLNYNFLWIAIPIVIGLELIFAKLSTREIYRSRLRNNYFPTIIAVFLTISFVTSHSIHIWADATRHEDINILRPVFPAHYPMTAKSFLSNHGWIKTNTLSGVSTADIAIRYPLEPLSVAELKPHRNMVMVFINGMSYSDLNAETMPNLYNLKQNSQSFENHYLPYNSLEDNDFALTYGIPIQYRSTFKSKNIAPVIVDEMHRQEYLVRIISSNYDAQNSNFTGFRNINFDNLKSDSEAVDKACNYINSIDSDRRFALNISLNSLCQNDLTEQKRANILKNIDKELQKLEETLNNSGRLNNTIILITSSKGNSLLNDGSNIYNRLSQHVPLIIKRPDESIKGVNVETLTSVYDIPATFGKEVLGISNETVNYSLGISLKEPINRDFFVTTKGDKLLLVSSGFVTVYDNNGTSYIESGGRHLKIRPNLKNLIRAMQDLNRFKD